MEVGFIDSLRRRLGREKSPLERLAPLGSGWAGAAAATGAKEDPLVVVRACRDRTQSVRSYRSHAVIRDAGNPPAMDGPLQYVVEAIRPDRFHVWQNAWMDKHEVNDEWITLGEDQYDNVGLWGRSLTSGRHELNGGLALEAFLGLLDSVQVDECDVYELHGRSFFRLDTDKPPPALAQGRDTEESASSLWIDGGSWLPAKVNGSALFRDEGASARLAFEQVFYDYDAEISIVPPEVGIT